MKDKKPLSLYLHVPFCESRCHYCDFYSNTNCSAELKDRYTKALINTLAAPISKNEYIIKSVYFGGGTPALLGEANISDVLERIYKNYTLDKNCEITLETNPYSAGRVDFNLLSKSGINRVSVGIQSLHDDVLMEIGRSHDRKTALSCLNMLCETDIEKISTDLMFGLPEQNIEMLLEDLDIITGYGNRIGHISLYDLKLEPGTRMYERRNMFSFPDDDEEADMYFTASEFLASKGFEHYEISNFALTGCSSVHNMNYWQCGDFLGFGASAHSRYNDKLFSVSPDMHRYIELAEKSGNIFEISNFSDVDALNEEETDEVYIMMSLRTSEGLDLRRLKNADEFIKKGEKFLKSGMLIQKNNNFRLSEKAFFISNQILSSLI